MDSVNILQSMFPNVDPPVIADVLRRNRNNVQKSVDELLRTGGVDKESSTHQQVPPVSSTPYMVTRPADHGLHIGTVSNVVKKLIILRGLPGSGKTTIARQLVGINGIICCTDDYFITNGRYLFDPTKISEYHQKNQEKATQSMREDRTPVIIDNTNVSAWEMKPYVTAGMQYGYDIEFKEPDTTWKFNVDYLERSNKHGVGREAIERMKDRYEHNITIEKVLSSERPEPRPQYNPFGTNSGYSGYYGNHQQYSRTTGIGRYNSHFHTGGVSPRSNTGGVNPHSHTGGVNPHSHTGRVSPRSQTRLPRGQGLIRHEVEPQTQDWIRNWSKTGSHTTAGSQTGSHTTAGSQTETDGFEEDILNFSPPAETTLDDKDIIFRDSVHSTVMTEDTSIVTAKLDTTVNKKFDEVVLSKLNQIKTTSIESGWPNFTGGSSPALYSIQTHTDSNIHTSTTKTQTDTISTHTNAIKTQTNTTKTQTNPMIKTQTNATKTQTDPVIKTQTNTTKTHTNTTTNTTDVENETDLEFLQSCFSNFSPAVLKLLYEKSKGDLLASVDLALLMPLPQTMPTDDKLMSEDMQFDQSPLDASYDEEELSKMEREEKGETNELGLDMSDEEYAIALQQQLRLEDLNEFKKRLGSMGMRPEGAGTRLEGTGMGTRPESVGTRQESTGMRSKGIEMDRVDEDDQSDWDDTNLLLKLTPSLARQLQSMFGPVSPHLFQGGVQDEENLIVLLNEPVALGIYQKWKDTLEAKKIEHELTKQFKKQSGTADAVTSAKRKKRKRNKNIIEDFPAIKSHHQEQKWIKADHAPDPTPLVQIMEEELAKQVGQQEVDERVEDAMKKMSSMKMDVHKLYETFPSLNRSVIHWYYYKARFNYEKSHSDLSKIATVSRPPPTFKPGSASRAASVPQVTTSTFEVDEGEGDDDDEDFDYEDLRAEAAIHAKLRAEAFQKAAEARGRKQGELAVHYAHQGHLHTERMNDANRRAAAMTFKMKNKGRPNDTLDLHCLHVSEALETLAEKLKYLKKGSHLFVITGRGLHSKGVAKLKPAVMEYLRRGHWRYEEINAGLIKVTPH